jgi:hypothetical protein
MLSVRGCKGSEDCHLFFEIGGHGEEEIGAKTRSGITRIVAEDSLFLPGTGDGSLVGGAELRVGVMPSREVDDLRADLDQRSLYEAPDVLLSGGIPASGIGHKKTNPHHPSRSLCRLSPLSRIAVPRPMGESEEDHTIPLISVANQGSATPGLSIARTNTESEHSERGRIVDRRGRGDSNRSASSRDEGSYPCKEGVPIERLHHDFVGSDP